MKANEIKGFWNGEPCVFLPIEYQVKSEPTRPTYWFNQFIGQIRQGLKVEYKEDVFYIDNQHGDGYYKLTMGKGSVSCGHKSISFESFIELPIDKLVTKYDTEALINEEIISNNFIKEFDPEMYEKLQAAKRMLNKSKW